MILDHLDNVVLYKNIDPNLTLGLDFIKNTDFSKLEEGKHLINGEDVFAILQSYDSKPESECRLESHKKYVDIQYVISGEEYIGVTSFNNQAVLEDLPHNDVTFFEGTGQKIKVTTGNFAVFFQTDIHAPCIKIGHPKKILKVVVKVALKH